MYRINHADGSPSGDELARGWEEQAHRWAAWARQPGHDSYWQFHREQFFEILPPPGEHTVDIGCGEGRLPRDLQIKGHRVTGVDASPTLIRLAREADAEGQYIVANAAAVPLPDDCADLVVAFMSMQDVDDLDGAIGEVARLLRCRGKACVAIVHPINSAGRFASTEPLSHFVIEDRYIGEFNYHEEFERDGLAMTFHSAHRTIERYSRAFERAGLLIECIREHPVPDSVVAAKPEAGRWQRVPMFMHFRLLKP